MKKRLVLVACIIIFMLLVSGCGRNEKVVGKIEGEKVVITDCIGRKVEIPAKVEKIGCLYAISGHIVTMLGKGENIVAVSNGLKRDKILHNICPSIVDALVPKANGVINIEELAKTNPDVIFVDIETAMNQGETEKFAKFHIPYLVVNYKDIEGQKYAVKMIAQAIGGTDKAQKYDEYYDKCIEKVSQKVRDIPEENRVRLYHSVLEAARTDARDTLPADWTQIAGAINVSVDQELRFVDNKYFASLEQILLWNPDVIIVNEEGVDKYIMTNEQWENLKAVKEKKVYKMPTGISRWGHPGSLETPLAILWTAKTLYPEYFPDIDMAVETKMFYQQFFDYQLSNEIVDQILSGKGMRKPKNN